MAFRCYRIRRSHFPKAAARNQNLYEIRVAATAAKKSHIFKLPLAAFINRKKITFGWFVKKLILSYELFDPRWNFETAAKRLGFAFFIFISLN